MAFKRHLGLLCIATGLLPWPDLCDYSAFVNADTRTVRSRLRAVSEMSGPLRTAPPLDS